MKQVNNTENFGSVQATDFCAPITVIVGHYGVGKTNFALNVARDLKHSGKGVTLIDLDVVNPYFRSSDYAEALRAEGIAVITPVFAGSTLDVPSLSGAIYPAIEAADEQSYVVLDVGGDDVGATSLGRFAEDIIKKSYHLLYVINASRNLTQRADETVQLLREIEQRSGLVASGLVNNTHLKEETTFSLIEKSFDFAHKVERATALPLEATTIPSAVWNDIVTKSEDKEDTTPIGSMNLSNLRSQKPYIVQVYVGTPWELQTK